MNLHKRQCKSKTYQEWLLLCNLNLQQLSHQRPYKDYGLELEAWTLSADVEKKKKKAVIAARSLSELLDGVKLRNKLMKNVILAELSKDTGMNKLLE